MATDTVVELNIVSHVLMLLSLLYSNELDVSRSLPGQLSVGGSPHMGVPESNPGGSPGGKRWNLPWTGHTHTLDWHKRHKYESTFQTHA